MTRSSDAGKGIQENLESRKDLSPIAPLRKRRKPNLPVQLPGAAEAKQLRKESGELGQGITSQRAPDSPYTSLGLDLNIAQVPICNEVATPLGVVGISREEETIRGQVAKSHGRGESENVVLRVEGVVQKKSARLEAALDSNILVTRHPSGVQDEMSLAEKLKLCVKTILQLEKSNHITREFRLQFLTWYTRDSSEWEKTVVNTYIKFFEDPDSLAEQLIHSFSAAISASK